MTDFPLPLDGEARAYALIGRFLQMWSLMECELNDAIGEALDLSSMQTEILCNNIQLRNRLHILRTLAAISALDEEEKRRIDKRLNQIGEYISHRNMVAHTPFVPSEMSNGVQFVGAKARGALKFFVEDWSVEKFREIDKTIAGFMGELASLRKTLEIPGDAIREYAASYYAKTDAGSGL
jgi:hypothetical protein